MRVIAAVTIALLLITTAAAEIEFRDDEDVQYHTGIDMNQNPLIGLPDPEADSEPVPFGFLSQQYVAREGDSMEGNLEMQGNTINMEDGEIQDASQIQTTDISGLNFLVPDEELQITEDVDIGGDIEVSGELELAGSYVNEQISTSHDSGETHYLLLAPTDETTARISGTFYGTRGGDGWGFDANPASNHPGVSQLQVSFALGDDAESSGNLIGMHGSRSSGMGFEFVTVEYEGDEYHAIEHQTGSNHGYWNDAYFAGFISDRDAFKFRYIPETNSNIDDISESSLDENQEITIDTDNLEIYGDFDVQGEASFGEANPVEISGESGSDNIVRARNFGETPSGVSQYLVGQTGDRSLRWRDNLVSVYDSLQVGDGYGTNSPDYTLDIHGDARFRDNIDLDGNDIAGVNFLAPEDTLQITDDAEITGDLDMSSNDITGVDSIELNGDFSYLGNNGLSVGDPDGSGRGGERSSVAKRLPSQPEGDAGGVWILGPAGDEHFDMIGTISGYRTTGANGLREIHIGYSSRSSGPDSRYRASLDAMQSTYRSGDWQLVFVTYEGEEYVALYHSQSSCCLETNSFFTGYISDQADSMDAGMFESVEVDDPDDDSEDDIIIEETVNYASYRYFMQDVGIGVEQPSSELEVDGDIVASGDIEGASKNFVQTINDTHEAVYTSQESDDARAVVEDSASLEAGEKLIEFPNHFSKVISGDEPDFNVQLTPKSTETYGLSYTMINNTHVKVEELMSSENSIEFDYRISAVREGHEDRTVVRTKQ